MSVTAAAAFVAIVTSDTKVVHRGASDKLFISDDATVVLAAGRAAVVRRSDRGAARRGAVVHGARG